MNEGPTRPSPTDSTRALILVGPPGAGKGTQGRILGMLPGFVHWEAGKILREIDPASDLGRKTSAVLERGDLLPDELVVEIFRNSVFSDPAHRHWGTSVLVLDGIPRTTGQARMLAELVDVFLVLHLAAPDPNQLVERLARRAQIEGRADDESESIVRHRIEVYLRETEPVLCEFPADLVIAVDAMRDPAVVTYEILGHILERRGRAA